MTVIDRTSSRRFRFALPHLRLKAVALSVVAWPFVAAGWIGGLTVVGLYAAAAAVRTGYADVLDRYPRAG